MYMNKSLSIFISIVSILGNCINANNGNKIDNNIITLEITEHSDIFICHKNKCVFFECYNGYLDSAKCSERLSEVTNGCFNASSCILENNNKFIFNNVSNTKPCTLLLKCSTNFKPDIVFDCGNNKVNFIEIVSCDMNSFKVISQKPLKIKKWISVDTINNKKKVYNTKYSPLVGAIVNESPYTYFELSVESKNE